MPCHVVCVRVALVVEGIFHFYISSPFSVAARVALLRERMGGELFCCFC